MKSHFFLFFTFLIFSLSCKTEINHQNPQNREDLMPKIDGYQTYRFEDQAVTMLIPSGWEVQNKVFYDSSRSKIAELAPGFLEPVDPISPGDFTTMIKNRGPDIRGRNLNFSFVNQYTFIRRDSVNLGMRNWHRAITEETYETDESGTSVWYPHYYVTQVDSRLFIIIFYPDYLNFPQQAIADTMLKHILFLDEDLRSALPANN